MAEEVKQNAEVPTIVFFCRDCQHVISNPQKIGVKYEYKCGVCKGTDVAFGTRKSILDYFRLKEKDLIVKEVEPKAV
ncbi:MAG: hypothetical protein WCT46_01160 [Candidatus Gracilibacteria bacterium]|jgi:predicted methyltransferase